MDDEIQQLYRLVFKVSKHFIEQYNDFEIHELAGHDEPTYEELAKRAKRTAEIISIFAAHSDWSGERIALNARQAALHMQQMAVAITENNQEDLAEAARLLNAMDLI